MAWQRSHIDGASLGEAVDGFLAGQALEAFDDGFSEGDKSAYRRHNLAAFGGSSLAELYRNQRLELVAKVRYPSFDAFFSIRAFNNLNAGGPAHGHLPLAFESDHIDCDMLVLLSQFVEGEKIVIPSSVGLKISERFPIRGGQRAEFLGHPLVGTRLLGVPGYRKDDKACVCFSIGGLNGLNDKVVQRASDCADYAASMGRQDVGQFERLRSYEKDAPRLRIHIEHGHVAMLLDNVGDFQREYVHLGARPRQFGAA